MRSSVLGPCSISWMFAQTEQGAPPGTPLQQDMFEQKQFAELYTLNSCQGKL